MREGKTNWRPTFQDAERDLRSGDRKIAEVESFQFLGRDFTLKGLVELARSRA